jgi:hypothetical protein
MGLWKNRWAGAFWKENRYIIVVSLLTGLCLAVMLLGTTLTPKGMRTAHLSAEQVSKRNDEFLADIKYLRKHPGQLTFGQAFDGKHFWAATLISVFSVFMIVWWFLLSKIMSLGFPKPSRRTRQ